MKPYELTCKKYCPNYPCDKTECNRKVGWRHDGELTMLEETESIRTRNRERFRLWREDLLKFVEEV